MNQNYRCRGRYMYIWAYASGKMPFQVINQFTHISKDEIWFSAQTASNYTLN